MADRGRAPTVLSGSSGEDVGWLGAENADVPAIGGAPEIVKLPLLRAARQPWHR
jgi:hypothetical protein